MIQISRNRLCLFALFPLFAPMFAHAQFIEPTPAELSMTSIPQEPGAAAVYLFREETTDDAHHVFTVYVRLKVLTEKGKEFGNVSIPFERSEGSMTVDSISGRTIHADGTVIPMKDKAYEKLVDKIGGAKLVEKVFSLPSVEVGSIIEYRYKLHSDDGYVTSPKWYIQSDLYTLKAHYNWRPTSEEIVSRQGGHERVGSAIAWMPILPKGAVLKPTESPGIGGNAPQRIFDLSLADIPPAPKEEFMPPMESFTYRVIFYYAGATSTQEFWKDEGKYWSKVHDQFIGPNKGVKEAVQQLVLPADTQEQKLQKIYAAVMALENTDFTREHTTAEERAAGLKQVKTTDDILARKRGSSDQLANLFIAMARAAGMKAYAMSVVNRSRSLFAPALMDASQLDDDIAIVNVDGKERYFDPGQRFCDFGHLAWKHTMAGGLRQTDKEAQMFQTPGESYKAASVKRIADLKMDEHGEVTGKVDLSYTGDPALSWRQEALRGDDTSLNKDLRESLEAMMPSGLEIRVTGVEAIADYDKPLVVHYTVSGVAGNATGKRLLAPSDIFVASAKPTFSVKQRTTPVYFHYASVTRDAVRISFPPAIRVESAPAKDTFMYKKLAAYDVSTEQTATNITVRRNLTIGEILFDAADFPELLSFYNKLETKDQEPVVLVHADAGAGAKPGR
ncbi:Transglutaminase-like superfamily protein [Granulicella rosea]|uniref:Transglutaminase-like superfamily protein n=1 Tax=Granulicella rosea TaxID=474952 RepID=A0A239EWR4_9BACT|nr:DUF3857 and transglutaminase domain-containing protein [Granulicella rosea]SNS49059.1 Transglutaminase-like superfamily protein [Granulicella rosea]